MQARPETILLLSSACCMQKDVNPLEDICRGCFGRDCFVLDILEQEHGGRTRTW